MTSRSTSDATLVTIKPDQPLNTHLEYSGQTSEIVLKQKILRLLPCQFWILSSLEVKLSLPDKKLVMPEMKPFRNARAFSNSQVAL